MNRFTAILMAGAFVLALAIPAAAQYDTQSPQTTPSTDMTRTATGTVVSVSAISLVIKTASGEQMIFVRDPDSSVPATVGTGSAVRVEYESPEPGTFRVTNVMVDASASGATTPTHETEAVAPAAGQTNTSSPSTEPLSEQNGATSEAMPKTASPFPIIGFVGLLAFAGGVTIRSLLRS